MFLLSCGSWFCVIIVITTYWFLETLANYWFRLQFKDSDRYLVRHSLPSIVWRVSQGLVFDIIEVLEDIVRDVGTTLVRVSGGDSRAYYSKVGRTAAGNFVENCKFYENVVVLRKPRTGSNKLRKFVNKLLPSPFKFKIQEANQYLEGMGSQFNPRSATGTVPFEGASYTLNGGVQVNNLTPEQLEKLRQDASQSHQGTRARGTILPRVSEVFNRDAMMERLRRRVGLGPPPVVEPIRHIETPLGDVLGQSVLDVAVPLVPERTTASSDDRIPSRERQRSVDSYLRVGAVEVVLEGLAASGSDNQVVAVLYDSRHANPSNSIRGMQVSSAASTPTRVVYFPGTRLREDGRENTALRLAVVSPESDMAGWAVSGVRVGVVSQRDQGSHQERMTREALRRESGDRAMAVNYANQNCVVVTPPEVERPISGRYRVPLARTTSMRSTGPGRWEEIVHPQQYAELDLSGARHGDTPLVRGNHVVNEWNRAASESSNAPARETENRDGLPARLQNDGTPFEPNLSLVENFTFLPAASENDRFLLGKRCKIPVSSTIGTVIAKITMADIVEGNGKAAQAVKYAISVDRAIDVVMDCNLAKQSAIGLGIAFADSGSSDGDTVSCKEYLSFQSSIWNPAMTRSHNFSFDPCKCSSEWYPSWGGFLKSHLIIFVVDTWSSVPKTEAYLSLSIRLADRRNTPMVFSVNKIEGYFPLCKFLGNICFDQGSNTRAHRAELSLGTPSVISAGFVPTLGTQILALNSYWKGSLMVRFTRTGTSFVGATLACCAIVGDVRKSITVDTISQIPHHSFVVREDCSNIVEVIPFFNIGMMYSCDRGVMNGKKRSDRGLQLAIWVKDGVTANTDDKLKFSVSIIGIQDLVVAGAGAGYPHMARLQYEGPKWNDVLIFDGPKIPVSTSFSLKKTYRDSPKESEVSTPKSTASASSGTSDSLVTHLSIPLINPRKYEKEGEGVAHVCPSPLVLLMDSATWLTGKLHLKLMWVANPTVRKGEIKGCITYSIHPDGIEGYAIERRSFDASSGVHEFFYDVVGPVNSYLNSHQPEAHQASPILHISVTNPAFIQGLHVMMAFGENAKVAGHNISEDSIVEGAQSWSEFYVE